MLVPCVQGAVSGAVVTGFVAGSWGTVIANYDASVSASITVGSGVTGIADQGPNGYNLDNTSLAGFQRPTYTDTQNGLNVLTYAAQFTNPTTITTLVQPYTIAVVAACTAAGWIFSLGGVAYRFERIAGPAWRIYTGAIGNYGTADSSWHVHVIIVNGSSTKGYVDGSLIATVDPSTGSATTVALVGNNTSMTGKYGQGILYGGAVSDPAGLSNALKTKWGT